jgi:hypothetical protein
MDTVKPVFRGVASVDLMKRCLHGKTIPETAGTLLFGETVF